MPPRWSASAAYIRGDDVPAVFPFTPSQTSVFQFQPILDGNIYSATVPWLLFGARYYLNLVAIDGTLIWYGAIVGSPSAFALSSLAWSNGSVDVVTALPHGLKTASTVSLNISGNAPDAYNGLVECFITGPSSFSFDLAVDPGIATLTGQASQDVNLIGGVPNESGTTFANRLVFRQDAQQFEVW